MATTFRKKQPITFCIDHNPDDYEAVVEHDDENEVSNYALMRKPRAKKFVKKRKQQKKSK